MVVTKDVKTSLRSFLSIMVLKGSSSWQKSNEITFSFRFKLVKQISTSPGGKFSFSQNSLTPYFYIIMFEFSYSYIFTFSSSMPELIYSRLQDPPPLNFRQIGVVVSLKLSPATTLTSTKIVTQALVLNTFIGINDFIKIYLQIRKMSYWDIDNFLTEQQRIQCSFTQEATGMDFIDTAKGISGPVPAGLPLHVPIWLANTLHLYLFKEDGDEVLKIEIPNFLQRDQLDDYFNAVETDKRAKLEDINLHSRCPYFFKLHNILDKILENETNLMSKERIKNILVSRGASILSRASTFQQAKKVQSRFSQYTQSQRILFKIIREKCEEYQNWECKSHKKNKN